MTSSTSGELITSGEFPEKFKCPVCFEIPQKEIYQCRNGHMVCDTCIPSIWQCPQCRVNYDYPKIRSRGMEEILDLLKFDCDHKHNGCTVKISRKEWAKHMESCRFGKPSFASICQAFGGNNCGFTAFSTKPTEALRHYVDVHELFRVQNQNHILMILNGTDAIKKECNGRWQAVGMDLLKSGFAVIIFSQFSKSDQTLSLLPLEISNPVGDQVKIEFTVKPVSDEKLALTWSTAPIPLCHAQDFISSPPYRIPLKLLLDHYKHFITGDSFQVTCQVVNLPGCSVGTPYPSSVRLNYVSDKPIEFTTCRNCQKCKQQIAKFHYQCLQCPGVHLCKACFEKGFHFHHVMGLATNMNQEEAMFKALVCNKFWIILIPKRLTSGKELRQEYAFQKCIDCQAKAVYICMTCTDFQTEYCETCFDRRERKCHKTTTLLTSHFFAVVKSKGHLKAVVEFKLLGHLRD